MRSARAAGVLLAALLAAETATADLAELGDDGWYTWRVAAVAAAPERCCFEWNRGRARPSTCRLDERRGGHGTLGDSVNATGQFQVYVRMVSGRVDDIRTLSSNCPVTGRSAIVDLGVVAAGDSVAWLRSAATTRLADEAIASIAHHAGADARDTLVAFARHDDDPERREDGVERSSRA